MKRSAPCLATLCALAAMCQAQTFDLGLGCTAALAPAQPAGEAALTRDRSMAAKSLHIGSPAGAGPAGRPNQRWVREVEVFSRPAEAE